MTGSDVLFVIGLVIACYLVMRLGTRRSASSKAIVQVDIEGDSIPAGFGSSTTLARLLTATNDRYVFNDHCVVGLSQHDFVRGYKEPFPSAPTAYFPRGPQKPFKELAHAPIVVLSFGANDIFQDRHDVDAFEKDLRDTIEMLLGKKCKVMLTGIPPLFAINDFVTPQALEVRVRFNEVTRHLAKEYGLLHAGWDMLNQTQADTTDGIHRTTEGLMLLALAVNMALPY